MRNLSHWIFFLGYILFSAITSRDNVLWKIFIMTAEASVKIGLKLLQEIRDGTRDSEGVTRIAYGNGEIFAHKTFERFAIEAGARIEHDAAGNTIALLDGEDTSLPIVMTGSHLDSVRQGGNYDGAAGVAAGLACLHMAKGVRRKRSLAIVAFRGEESC